MSQKKSHKILTGIIVSNKMNKTIVVKVERKFAHPDFKKVVKRTKKYKCHDEENKGLVGDVITMIQVRPLSKEKRWSLTGIIKSISQTG